MRKRTRKQHYLPRSYLAGLTASGSQGDLLHVLDQVTGKRWRAKVGEVATQKDLYTAMDGNRGDPEWFEKYFQASESMVALDLRRVARSGQVGDRKVLSKLIHFVAMMTTRTPSFFDDLKEYVERRSMHALQEAVRSPEAWEVAKQLLCRHGKHAEEVSHEDIKAFVESDSYTIKLRHSDALDYMLKYHDHVARFLCLRTWALLVAPASGPYFICSDVPVSLNATEPLADGERLGFAQVKSQVVLPLSKEAALVGTFGGRDGSLSADDRTVALVNGNTLAGRYVFSGEPDFVW